MGRRYTSFRRFPAEKKNGKNYLKFFQKVSRRKGKQEQRLHSGKKEVHKDFFAEQPFSGSNLHATQQAATAVFLRRRVRKPKHTFIHGGLNHGNYSKH
jgi:hypothetical protein